MKRKLPRPSPAVVIALLALFVALGGVANALVRNSVGARELAPVKVRSGKVRDTDTTAGDGVFNQATGRARCKRGEQLISGGLRLRRNLFFGPQQVAMTSSGPIPRFREWGVTMNSDLGGAARDTFVVFAICLVR